MKGIRKASDWLMMWRRGKLKSSTENYWIKFLPAMAKVLAVVYMKFSQYGNMKILVGSLVPLYEREEIRKNNNEAASVLICMPGAIRSGAALCGAAGEQEEAEQLMKLSEQLAEELEQALASANIEKERVEKLTRILVAFDWAKHHKEYVKG